jgi:peptidyl-prolyl cis-trans isomerase B (cyclophilin B)
MARALALLASALLVGALPATSWPPNAVLSAEVARTVSPALTIALSSSNESMAVQAALALGRTKQVAAGQALARYVGDARPAVRAMAVYGLGLVASGRRAETILRALHDKNGAVRVAALDAADRYAVAQVLSAAMQRALASAVLERLAADPDPIVRARAAATLTSFDGAPNPTTTTAALVRAVERDRSDEVRRFAMWSVFRGYAKFAPHAFLARALRDRDEVVRIEAVRAIGRRDDSLDAELVRPLLADASWRVQEQASETLRLLSGKPLTQHWKAIPSWVHVPGRRTDPLGALPALPRTLAIGKPHTPTVAQVVADARLWTAKLDPTTAAAMSGPAPGAHPRVRIVTTKGNVYVTLFPEWAPFTVENFLALANRGYYYGNRWFRIVPDFVVQTGDPNDNGNGDAGYTIPAEENPIPQDSYVISMGLNYTNGANAHAIRDSAGTQYYITLSPQLHLDRDFTVFGEVTGGFDVLGRLVEADRVVRVERIKDEML